MLDEVRRVLEADDRVAYALLFGSAARGAAHSGSDLDLGLGLKRGLRLGVLELGELVSRLDGAAGQPVDLVLLEEAPPGIAYRAFRDGQLIFERDRSALVARKARAILEYLDYRPIEELCAHGVLAVASRG